MSIIIIGVTNFESVIYFNFLSKKIGAVKELHKVTFLISIYISIRKITMNVTYKQKTPNSGAIKGVGRSWWDGS